MVYREEFSFPSSDGIHTVHGLRWRGEGAPRAVVQLVHGISEYIGRYDPFAAFLAERGFLVVGHDHLGHGHTARGPQEYGYLGPRDGWSHLVEDVWALRQRTGADWPGLPYFLLGHSMGSFVARTYLIDHPGTLTGCILSGTGQEPGYMVAFGRALTGLLGAVKGKDRVSPLVTALTLGAYNGRFKPNRTGCDWISRDDAVVDAYVKDPLCQFVPTLGMNHDMMGGLAYIARRANLARMDPDTPVLFFSGDADPVGQQGAGVEKVALWFRSAGCRDVTVRLYPGGRHEMLNEVNRQEVFEDAAGWLEARVGSRLPL